MMIFFILFLLIIVSTVFLCVAISDDNGTNKAIWSIVLFLVVYITAMLGLAAGTNPDVDGFKEKYYLTCEQIDTFNQCDSVAYQAVDDIVVRMAYLNAKIDRNRRNYNNMFINWFSSEEIAVYPKFDIDKVVADIKMFYSGPSNLVEIKLKAAENKKTGVFKD